VSIVHFGVENVNRCLTAGVVLEFQRPKNSSAGCLSDTVVAASSFVILCISYLPLKLQHHTCRQTTVDYFSSKFGNLAYVSMADELVNCQTVDKNHNQAS